MEIPSTEEVKTIASRLQHAVDNYYPDAGLRGAASRAEIREQAKRLFLSTMTPQELGVQHCKDMSQLVTLRACMKLGLIKNLPSNGSISSSELGKISQVSPTLIERMFRILVATGFIDQDNEGAYKHTHFSHAYTDPMVPGPGSLVQGMYDEYMKHCLKFDEYITTRHQPPYPEPADVKFNCYNWDNGKEGQSFWETMSSRPERMAVFATAFSGLDVLVPPVGTFYDFNALATDTPDRVELVDVGGGNGRVLREILAASPQLHSSRCALQDLASVLQHADEARKAGIQVQVTDFYTEQPIKGAKAYYLRFVLHDHSDEACIGILAQLAKAMAPDSKLLVAEVIVPERITEANIDATVFDQILMAIGGKERTAKNFHDVFEAAGLQVQEIHHVPGTVGGLVEGKLKG